MSRRQPYLERRQAIFYLRLPIPGDLQPLFARRELRWSLGTTDRRRAGQDALAGLVAFRSLCARLRRMAHLTEDEIRRLVVAYYDTLVDEATPPPLDLDESQRGYNAALAEDVIAGLKAVIETDDYEGSAELTQTAANLTRRATRDFSARHAVDLDQLPEPQRAMVLQGVARALLEQQRCYLLRLTDRLTPFTPQDGFFAHAKANAPSPGAAASPSLDHALKAYEAAKAGVHWKPRTVLEHKRVLRWAREFFGAQKSLHEITKADLRDFRDALLQLRRKGAGAAPFKSLMGAPAEEAISRKTASKYFGFVAAAFNWFVDEGHISSSPVGNISVAIAKSKKGVGRIPFSDDDLATLFSSPMYVGCLSATRRMTPGPHLITDGYYWVPLIGALSGMRLGEIVQLGLDDVVLDAPTPHFKVRENEQTGGTVKSDAGWRDVPVHKRLLELGLEAFVKSRQEKKASPRLFAEIKYGSDGSPSGEYSRWFGRRLDDIGLSKPGLVFHSFRGSFIGALTNLGAPPYTIKAIVGHDQSGDITFGYSGHEGVSQQKKREWIDKVAYLALLPTAK